MKNLGALYIISAASGTGKTTLIRELVRTSRDMVVSISYTTRSRRPEEKEGVDYFFVSQKEFEERLGRNEFLENASIYGYSYATSKIQVEKHLFEGKDVILEIDWQGAARVRQQMKSVSVFILPPSKEVLLQRLTLRAQDDPLVVQRRLKMAAGEMAHCVDYDYLVMNDAFDEALVDLQAIVRAQRCRMIPQSHRWQKLIEELASEKKINPFEQ